jgi:hypothetical protein
MLLAAWAGRWGTASQPVLGFGSRLACGSSNHRPHGAVVDLACLVIALCFADRQPD